MLLICLLTVRKKLSELFFRFTLVELLELVLFLLLVFKKIFLNVLSYFLSLVLCVLKYIVKFRANIVIRLQATNVSITAIYTSNNICSILSFVLTAFPRMHVLILLVRPVRYLFKVMIQPLSVIPLFQSFEVLCRSLQMLGLCGEKF